MSSPVFRLDSKALRRLVLLLLLAPVAATASGELRAGRGIADITPPIGTPSAGYGDRMGAGMVGVHDRLVATALLVENAETRIALVGVDHLGFDSGMVAEITDAVHAEEGLGDWQIFVGSSHTHAGGGAYLDIPGLGQVLAGKFDPAARQLYVDGTVRAILQAAASLEPARIGIGYGRASGLNSYRGDWPPNVPTRDDVAVVKVTRPDGEPLAVLFNFAAHPTVLPGRENMLFSADFVGFARDRLREALGEDLLAVYFNGAQGDVSPRPPGGEEMFARAAAMGQGLADVVTDVWESLETTDELAIQTLRHHYEVEVRPTSNGVSLPFDRRPSELGLVTFDIEGRRHAFLAIPGELSCIYDADIKRFGGWLGYEHVSILGLTNDAHGYIITPESWRHRTYESTVSFGGELYGPSIESKAYALLHALEPAGAYQADQALPSHLLPSE